MYASVLIVRAMYASVLIVPQYPLITWTAVILCAPSVDIGYRRQGASLVVFGDSLWLLGGSRMFPDFPLETHFTTNDVYKTKDGYVWEAVLPAPAWLPRLQFVAAVLASGDLYIMGGWPGRGNGSPVRLL